MAWVTFVILWVLLFVFFEMSDKRNVNLFVKVILSGVGAIALTIAMWFIIKLLVLPTWLFLTLIALVIGVYFVFRKAPSVSK